MDSLKTAYTYQRLLKLLLKLRFLMVKETQTRQSHGISLFFSI